jgi:hypothetical protein
MGRGGLLTRACTRLGWSARFPGFSPALELVGRQRLSHRSRQAGEANRWTKARRDESFLLSG